jgi:uncharacterized protein with PIN domain
MKKYLVERRMIKRMRNRCESCGGSLLEDAWEEIIETDEGYMVDAFQALICRNGCGFYIRLN